MAHETSAEAVHIVPVGVLVGVWAALVVLTGVTVAATWFDFGSWSLWIAMGIATVKGSLVVLYFMHLRWDHPFYRIVFLGTLGFVLLFVGLVLVDTTSYQGEINPAYGSRPAATRAP